MTAKKWFVGAVGAVALMGLSGPALAGGFGLFDRSEGSTKDGPAPSGRQFSWSVNVGGTSDYVFRGISQSDEKPAIQAGIDLTYGIFYVGAWGSTTDLGVGDNAEIDWYAGIKPVLGPLTFDFGVIYYTYPGTAIEQPVEVKAGVAWSPVKDLATGFIFYWEPDLEYQVYEFTAAYTLPSFKMFTPTIGGTFGIVEDNDGFLGGDYNYWNVGLALAVDKITLDFRYWDTDIGSGSPVHGLADERFVFTAKVTLP